MNSLHPPLEWPPACPSEVVLRITVPNNEESPVFIIEGRLTGEWVGELLSVTRNLPPGTNSVFQIEDVLFVDSLGERALQWLNHLGATFSVRNAYGVDLCQRLHLRRCAAEASAGRGKEGRRRLETAPEQPINSRNSKTLGQGCNEKD